MSESMLDMSSRWARQDVNPLIMSPQFYECSPGSGTTDRVEGTYLRASTRARLGSLMRGAR